MAPDSRFPQVRHRLLFGGAVCLLVVSAIRTTGAATLEPRTLHAYKAYLAIAVERFSNRGSDGVFLWTDERPDRRQAVREGRIIVEPASEDGILDVPGGLIHHWTGAGFLEGVGLEDALRIVQAYGDYPRIHPPIVQAELIERTGDTARVFIRLRKSTRFVTAVFDVWWNIRYYYPGDDRAYSRSNVERIVQVMNAGRSDEHQLAEGTGGGYLWAANTFSRFLERDGGTYIEFQTLALSRGFPRLLGWIAEPIARRVGAGSVADTLSELRDAAETTR